MLVWRGGHDRPPRGRAGWSGHRALATRVSPRHRAATSGDVRSGRPGAGALPDPNRCLRAGDVRHRGSSSPEGGQLLLRLDRGAEGVLRGSQAGAPRPGAPGRPGMGDRPPAGAITDARKRRGGRAGRSERPDEDQSARDLVGGGVWAFVEANAVPVHALHRQGYASIGCAPCTRSIAPGEHVRAGRWWWEDPNRKECGLHRR